MSTIYTVRHRVCKNFDASQRWLRIEIFEGDTQVHTISDFDFANALADVRRFKSDETYRAKVLRILKRKSAHAY